jgi:sensor c-di-GMP phosphodiesterase-like protein
VVRNPMNRFSFLAVSIFLASAATLVPVVLCAYIAQQDAQRREEAALKTFADNAIIRAEIVTKQAEDAVAEMERLSEPQCSPAHLEQLRRVSFTWRYVQDAGVYRDGMNLCSALLGAAEDRHLRLPAPTWLTRNGFLVWFDLDNPFGAERKSMLIGRNGNYVSVDPGAYVDVVDRDARLLAAVDTRTGNVFSVTRGADRQLMMTAWEHGGRMNDPVHSFVVKKSDDLPFAIVVEARRSSSFANWKALLTAWLLVGLAFGLVLGALVMRMLSRRNSMGGQLQRALRRREFAVYYQPIVSLADGRCVGAEALVRWVQDGHMVPPDVFIPLAEEQGLIQAITDQVLERVIAEMSERLRHDSGRYISINVSAEDLKTRRFLNELTARLAGTGIANAQIRIEATERGFLDVDATRRVIQAFRNAGHPVCIDDFGTGYSSLSYLQTFRFDVLKIDKSFVDTVGQDAASSSVAPHIIAMAHALGVEIVAEGIERGDQARFLREHGTQFGQGWLFARPMPAAEFLRFLDTAYASTCGVEAH